MGRKTGALLALEEAPGLELAGLALLLRPPLEPPPAELLLLLLELLLLELDEDVSSSPVLLQAEATPENNSTAAHAR